MYLLFMSAQALFTDGQKKNTPPEVPSNEKGRRNKLNGMISVDANTCLEYLKLKEKSKTEDVSDYFLQCYQDCLREGFEKLSIILDRDSTDKKKMKSQLKFHLINAQINQKLGVDNREKIATGQVIKALILNWLGMVSRPLYLFSQFF